MKICPKCHEEVEDSFEICWNCNYSFPDDKILDMTPAEESDDSGLSTVCAARSGWFIPENMSFMKE